MKNFKKYIHHEKEVWVEMSLKGKHRENCLCYSCKKFNTENRDKNCKTANTLYALCVEFDVVTPVYECPNFEEIIYIEPKDELISSLFENLHLDYSKKKV